MENQRLERNLKKLMHQMAEINQEIFTSGDYKDFLSLCSNDISVIAQLNEHPGMTAKQMSVRLCLPKTTVVSAVSRLVKRGYVTREQNPQDGREQLLMLTDLGMKVNMQHNQYEKYFMEGLIQLFREEDYESLTNILERSRVCSITE